MTNDVITFGCRLNIYESEVIKKNLAAQKLEGVTVFNTCAVTKEAERQARQAIRKYKRENPNKHVVVTGCAAQTNPEQFANIAEVDAVIGNQEKLEETSYKSLPGLITQEEKVQVNDIMSVKETASHMVASFDGKARAFMQIQNGCNHRCTFCIIPYGRGNSRSVPMGEIVEQATLLTAQGYQEIVLTGVDITDYGLDLPGAPTLGQMVKRLLALVPGLTRLRLSSIDVAEIDPDLMYLLKHEPRMMPHVHLSLQAGDNMVLKRMKRRHTREQVVDFCAELREARPDVAFGADIIAGFPTETEEMFQNTLNLVKECGLTHLHVFPYSEREGTPAAKIPSDKQVPNNLRKKRAQLLREAGQQNLQHYLQSLDGKTDEVLIENGDKAKTSHYVDIAHKGLKTPGKTQNVRLSYTSEGFLEAIAA